jgi:glycosyltransferase involved in cell wall biosynthesis
MRILHILNHARLGNGIVNVAVDLACTQSELGHHVAIAALPDNTAPILEKYQVQQIYFDQTRTPLNILKAAFRLIQIIHEFQPDIVHAHMMTGVVLAKILRAGRSYRLVSTVHNDFQKSAILMGFADRVIAVSQSVAELMQKRGISQHKLRVVLNGTVGSPRTGFLDRCEPKELQHPAITTVAGMFLRKGVNYLIEAFAKVAPDFPDAHLYLVGTGDAIDQFKALANQLDCRDRIHFEGHHFVPESYLVSTDIFVLASRQEPFGLVLTEAREAGCAVVATQVGGMPEALEQGAAGLLVPPQDSEALAAVLRQLLGDPNMLRHWQHQAKQNLHQWTVKRVNQQTLDVYNELLEQQGNASSKITEKTNA